MLLAYVREEIVVAGLDADRDEELAMLWRQDRRGGGASVDIVRSACEQSGECSRESHH
jgi:hypothetical protein